MKAAVAVLLAIALVLGWLLNTEMAINRQLKGQFADKIARDNLELQEKCAIQAKKIFDDPYYKAEDRNKPGGSSQYYQSHYNTKLGKCFMTITHGGTPPLCDLCSVSLLDAYEQRDYASYSKYPPRFNMPPVFCTLTPSSATERDCQSFEEFNAFVALYME